MENTTEIILEQIIKQLDNWIDTCEKNSEKYRECKLTSLELQSDAYSQAYWNIKQFIEVNYLKK